MGGTSAGDRSAGGSSAPDLIVVNARIATGNARRPWATGLAIRTEMLAAVGSAAELQKLAGPSTRVIDALGAELSLPAGVTVGSALTVTESAHGVLISARETDVGR